MRLAQPASMTLAAKINVPWDQTNRRHKVAARLLTEDGEQVVIGQPVAVEGEFEVGRPVGLPHGSTVDAPLVLTFNNLVLPSGRYEWRLEIDTEPAANVHFDVDNVMPQEGGDE